MLASSALMTWNLRRAPSAFTDPTHRFGFRAFGAHLLTVWALALSNATLGLAILWSAFHRRRLAWRWTETATLLLPLGFYVIFYAVSALTSIEPAVSALELKSILGLSTLPLTVLLVRDRRDVRHLFDLIIVMMVLLAVYGIGQYYLTDYGPLDNRIPGPFSHYMTFAGVLLLGVFLLLGRLATVNGWRRPWNWLALLVISTTLFLTLTRGAWVTAGVTFTVLLLIKARRFLIVYLAAIAVVGLLFASFGPEDWKQRIYSITDPRDESNYDRLSMLQAGIFMISERPLFGIGPGMVERRYPIYRHPTAPRFKVVHLHNSLLQIAAERGLLSLAAYLWLMIAGLRLAYRSYRRDGGARGESADLYLGTILVLIGFNLAGMFEANWRDTEIQRLVLFLLAVPLCLRPEQREESSA
ncbi:MAG: hypothetical protein GY719_05510 [bacterium]|nr:hypothetical protein [bacterium]